MDTNSAANAAMSQMRAATRLNSTACLRCGVLAVAWTTSKRTGKRYLVDLLLDNQPARGFHVCGQHLGRPLAQLPSYMVATPEDLARWAADRAAAKKGR
jgi:hypothetical protein